MRRTRSLAERFPPSPPCSCDVCVRYCARPGWWTVEEAALAIKGGYGGRMMLEMSPDRSFGVLAPAFRGCEVGFATQECASRGCNFLEEGRCELHGTGFQPLECRHCHHDRPGAGPACHAEIEKEWNGDEGRALIVRWSKATLFWEKLSIIRGADRPRT